MKPLRRDAAEKSPGFLESFLTSVMRGEILRKQCMKLKEEKIQGSKADWIGRPLDKRGVGG